MQGLSGRSVRDPGESLLEGDEGRKDVGVESHQGKSGKSGAGFVLNERSPLPGAAAEASTPT